MNLVSARHTGRRPCPRKESKQLDGEIPWQQFHHPSVAAIQKLHRGKSCQSSHSQEKRPGPFIRTRCFVAAYGITRSRAQELWTRPNQCRVVCLGHQDPDLQGLTKVPHQTGGRREREKEKPGTRQIYVHNCLDRRFRVLRRH